MMVQLKYANLKLIACLCLISTICCDLFGQQEKIKTQRSNNQNKTLNMLAFGYQIGGLTYAGCEYEYRFSKYIGLNTGAGFEGYTAGIKFHTCPCRTGPFLNISIKDGGFGKIGTINAELGGVLIFFDKQEKVGLMGQIGLGGIVYLSDNYQQITSKDYHLNDLVMAFGVGISYYINK
jgi:hypothetical protein